MVVLGKEEEEVGCWVTEDQSCTDWCVHARACVGAAVCTHLVMQLAEGGMDDEADAM